MKSEYTYAAVFASLFLLLMLAGCLNMTPRAEVPKEVVITISSTKNCTEANCTCLVEAKRPRYKWWSCEGGHAVGYDIAADLYNSTKGEYCEDIRVGGLPSQVCMGFNTIKPWWRVLADCTDVLCKNYWYDSCTGDSGECNLECTRHCAVRVFGHCVVDCTCHRTLDKKEQLCPLLTSNNPNCVCLKYHSWRGGLGSEGEVPCFGKGPAGTGCEVLIPAWYIPIYGSVTPCCILNCTKKVPASYKCTRNATGQVVVFEKCQFHYESSFQGGNFQVIQPCNASAMQNIIQDPLREIPFFMIGQGATFDAFRKAREYCWPDYTVEATVKLGDTVFHPPAINITNGSTICWESADTAHDLVLDDGAGGEFNSTLRLCLSNLTLSGAGDEFHTMTDKETKEISDITVSSEGHLYITEDGFTPRALIYPEGTGLWIHSTDLLMAHNIRIWDNQWGAGAPSAMMAVLPGASNNIMLSTPGPHLVVDPDNDFTAMVFITTYNKNVSVNDAGMAPGEVALRQGEQVCFTCETAIGHVLSIYRRISPSETVFVENKTLGGQKTCCWRPAPDSYLITDVNTSASIFVYVTGEKTEYRIDLRDYNFNPRILSVRNGTDICFQNPSAFERNVTAINTPAPDQIITIAPKKKQCGYFPLRDKQRVSDPLTGSNLTIIVYMNVSTFVNLTALGARPKFVQTVPGGSVCFANLDNIPHDVVYSQARSCFGGKSLGAISQTVVPNDVWCVTTPKEGAYAFTDSSNRVTSAGNITTNVNVTVLTNNPLNYTLYILDEPPVNGSIQPSSLFVLSNDTVMWANCRSQGYELSSTKKPLSEIPISMYVPSNRVIAWENLSVGSSTILATNSSLAEFNLTARLFVADKESFSEKTQYLYTGPATINNRSTHLAVNWLPGDIGGYTLWMARKLLGERSFTAFPISFKDRILITLRPKNSYMTASLRIPSGSNMTWYSVDSVAHMVRRSWWGGFFSLGAYPLGNITYRTLINNVPWPPNPIPAGIYNVSEQNTGVNYPVEAYNLDWTINLSMTGYNPDPLVTNLTKTVCFRNNGALTKVLLITPPPSSTKLLNEGELWTPPNGTHMVYIYNSGLGTKVKAHLLDVIDAAQYASACSLYMLCDYTSPARPYYAMYMNSSTLFASAPPLTISYYNATEDVPPMRLLDSHCCNGTGVCDCTSGYFFPWPPGICFPPPTAAQCLTFRNCSEFPACPNVECWSAGCRFEHYEDRHCYSRKLSVDGVFYQEFAPFAAGTWGPIAGSHNFEIFDSNNNTTIFSVPGYFGNPINLVNPLPYDSVALVEGDSISWTNLAAFGGDKVMIDAYLEPFSITLDPKTIECYTPPYNGTYKVDDISPVGDLLGSTNIIITLPEEAGVAYLDMLSASTNLIDIITTPLSHLTWHSADGKTYHLQTMAGNVDIPPDYTWNNPKVGTYVINETQTGLNWSVVSAAGNYRLPMFYQTNIFDSPTGILRPPGVVCFRNNETKSHTIYLCRYLPNTTLSGPPCVEFCNATFDGFDQTWTEHPCDSAAVPAIYTYTKDFWIDAPPLTTATLFSFFDDCGSITINGNLVVTDSTCPERNCNPGSCGCCIVAPLCNGSCAPCVPCGDSPPPVVITNALRAGWNRMVITVRDSFQACHGYDVRITGVRTYDIWSTTLAPSQTSCTDPFTIVTKDYPTCPPRPQVYNFSDNVTLDKFTLNVTNLCRGSEAWQVAKKLNRYDDLLFKNPEFDIIPGFNEHGPGWPSIVTSEVAQNDVNCVCKQLINITGECPNCTTALAVSYPAQGMGFISSAFLNPTCRNSTDVIALFIDGNNLASTIPNLCDGSCNCNFSKFWENLELFSKSVLYSYGKPTVILSFKMTEGLTPCFNGETIGRFYKDLYSNPATQLTGAGLFGISQTCLNEQNLNGDCFINAPNPTGYGLMTDASSPIQPEFNSWFSPCGAYYYNSQGLTMTTFSGVETNSTVCDSSRIMDLYNEYKCYAD